MAKHTVKQGECILSIAVECGFFPDTLWNHAENAGLKQERKDPNVLLLEASGGTAPLPAKECAKRHRAASPFPPDCGYGSSSVDNPALMSRIASSWKGGADSSGMTRMLV